MAILSIPAGRQILRRPFGWLAVFVLLLWPDRAQSAASAPAGDTVTLVLPKKLVPGEKASGSGHAGDTQKYTEVAGLRVVLTPVVRKEEPRKESAASAGTLSGYVFDVDGEEHRADQPVVLTISKDAVQLVVRLTPVNEPKKTVRRDVVPVVPIGGGSATAPPPQETPPSGCSMSPVTTAGGVEVIRGATSGDSRDVAVSVDDVPAAVVASTRDSVFWDVPEGLSAGPHRVVFRPSPGAEPVELTLYVLGLAMSADQTKLMTGQATPMHVVVTGLDQLPESAWESAIPLDDLVDLPALAGRVKGFRSPNPGEPGFVLLVIENRSPDVIRMGKSNLIVLELHRSDFAKGPFTYDDVLQSLHRGNFQIHGTVFAFVKASFGRASPPKS
jgi:hypothetical protein